MDKELVSILIPAFNRAALIAETLDSILAQTYQNWECIIVDDGSTDDTIAVVSNFVNADSRFQCYNRPATLPKGANACRNLAFTLARGKYVNWFDSDDIMEPEFIEAKVTAFNVNSALDAVISKRAFFTVDPKVIVSYEQRTVITPDTFTDFMNYKVSWYMSDVMWRSEFLVGRDLFDPELLAGQDRDFFAKMLLFNPRLMVIDRYLTLYRQHADNITSQINNIANNRLKISHLNGIVKLMMLVQQRGKLSQSIKICYFKTMMQYLPYVIGNKKDTKTLYTLLKSLSVLHFDVLLGWIKILVAHAALKLTGRGETLLK